LIAASLFNQARRQVLDAGSSGKVVFLAGISQKINGPYFGPQDPSRPFRLSGKHSSNKIYRQQTKELRLYYFAYGSNLDWLQMQRRCPSARFICIARLVGYRFAIARHSRLRNCGTANIFAAAGSEVCGVVYDVNEQDFAILDGFEDGYRRERLFVYDLTDGARALEVVAYIAEREERVPLPTADYKRHIVDGARYWQLPPSYCEMLEKIPAEPL
jgi:gamma-glutamylcyclotransferase (GGCT)/AIG2-like uncharacterized protein YtfP